MERTFYSFLSLNIDAVIPAVANTVDKFEHWLRQSKLTSDELSPMYCETKAVASALTYKYFDTNI